MDSPKYFATPLLNLVGHIALLPKDLISSAFAPRSAPSSPPSRVEADNVGIGEVDEECGADSLKDEAKVEHPVVHALLEDGEDSGLADDHIRPLDLQAKC